jgi:hypothetical protein
MIGEDGKSIHVSMRRAIVKAQMRGKMMICGLKRGHNDYAKLIPARANIGQ